MPDIEKIRFPGAAEETDVATETGLLKFANDVRELGGGEILPALLKSEVRSATKCLLARALNFESEVNSSYYYNKFDDGSLQWFMRVTDFELALKIAEGLKLSIGHFSRTEGHEVACILLPKHIGNAAAAFDAGIAFTEFR